MVKPEAAFVEAGTAIVGGSYVIPSDSGAPVTVSVTWYAQGFCFVLDFMCSLTL